MKKEYIFLGIAIIIIIISFVFKNFFITDKYIETKKILEQLEAVKSKYVRDSTFQANSDDIVKVYDFNKKNKQDNPSVMITDFVAKIEEFLIESDIEYQSTDIVYPRETTQKDGLEYLTASLSIKAEFDKLTKMIKSIEKSTMIIDIISFQVQKSSGLPSDRIGRSGQSQTSSSDDKKLNINITLQLVKIM